MTDLPPKVTKAAPRPQTVAVCLLVEETAGETKKGKEGEEGEEAASCSYLVVQRPDTGLLASLWEFPTVPVCEHSRLEPLGDRNPPAPAPRQDSDSPEGVREQVAEGASRLACRQALGSYLDQAAAIHQFQSASQTCSASSRAPAPREQRRQAAAAAAAAAAAEGEGASASAGGRDLARHMHYVGQVNFLFSHIKQTLEVGPRLSYWCLIFVGSARSQSAALSCMSLEG